jgi:hypothetical protein
MKKIATKIAIEFNIREAGILVEAIDCTGMIGAERARQDLMTGISRSRPAQVDFTIEQVAELADALREVGEDEESAEITDLAIALHQIAEGEA